MPRVSISDEEFAARFTAEGATSLAAALGINERNVYQRRANLSEKWGRHIPAPSSLYSLPDGSIRYERYLDGEHVRVRAHVYINGQDGPALSIRVPTEPLFAEGMHLLQMFSDLKGMRRL